MLNSTVFASADVTDSVLDDESVPLDAVVTLELSAAAGEGVCVDLVIGVGVGFWVVATVVVVVVDGVDVVDDWVVAEVVVVVDLSSMGMSPFSAIISVM